MTEQVPRHNRVHTHLYKGLISHKQKTSKVWQTEFQFVRKNRLSKKKTSTAKHGFLAFIEKRLYPCSYASKNFMSLVTGYNQHFS
jgi:hypothetical protein